MLIAGLNKTTLLDYPGYVAATVFVGGCNFRCPFCHNGGLVFTPLSQRVFSVEEVLSFLNKRKNLLKGVCISGGEPTLHADLPEFIEKIKDMGYRVKLDTNGYNPNVLKHLLDRKLLDYVAMDIKNCPEKYELTAGIIDVGNSRTGDISKDSDEVSQIFDMNKICQSVALLKESDIRYEFRTTVVKEFHTKEDLLKIADWIRGCPRYYLQQYQENENILCRIANKKAGANGGEEASDLSDARYFHDYTEEEMEQMAEMLRKTDGWIGEIILRMGNG